jgi:phosphoenolpyruvate carboxykinase (GTP)
LLSRLSIGKDTAPLPVVRGDWFSLPEVVRRWAQSHIRLCQPDALHIMDGSQEESAKLNADLVKRGVLIPLPKYDNCFLARTDPRDVARVESRTVISTPNKIDTVPEPAEGAQGQLGYWMSPEDLDDKIHELFPGCMKGSFFNFGNDQKKT